MDIFDALVANTDTSFLDNSTDDYLLTLLANELGTEYAQHFNKQYQLFLHYDQQKSAFVIDFDKVWCLMGFLNKSNAKRSLLNNKAFVIDVDYIAKNVQDMMISADYQVRSHGGSNKITILLNYSTFKQFCLVADTPKAQENRLYVGKIERVAYLYIEANAWKASQDIAALTRVNTEITASATHDIEWGRHSVLLKANRHISLFYAMRVQIFDDGSFVVKFGYTKNDVGERVTTHSTSFGCDALILDLFPCFNCDHFEKDMFQTAKFINIKYKERVNNKNKSNETFLFTDRGVYGNYKRFLKSEVKKAKYHCTQEEKIKLEELGHRTTELTNITLELHLLEKLIFRDDKECILKMMDVMMKANTIQTPETQTNINDIDNEPQSITNIQPPSQQAEITNGSTISTLNILDVEPGSISDTLTCEREPTETRYKCMHCLRGFPKNRTRNSHQDCCLSDESSLTKILETRYTITKSMSTQTPAKELHAFVNKTLGMSMMQFKHEAIMLGLVLTTIKYRDLVWMGIHRRVPVS